MTSEDNFEALKFSETRLNPLVIQLTQGQMLSSSGPTCIVAAFPSRDSVANQQPFSFPSTIVPVGGQATMALLLLRFRVWVVLVFRSTGFEHRLHWYGVRRQLGFTALFSDHLAQDLAKAVCSSQTCKKND